MTRWNSQRFLQDGLTHQVPIDVLQNAIATAEQLQAHNPRLPIVFSLRHLASLTRVPYEFLRQIVSRSTPSSPYRIFRLKKRGVGHGSRYRYICVPNPLLLRVQRWIHQNILCEVPSHQASSAYHPGSRVFDAAQVHCRSRWLIKVDVRSFFESIHEHQVARAFTAIGYQPLVAFELSRICTRLRNGRNLSTGRAPGTYKIRKYRNDALGHLPQGAPTSPIIANLVSAPLDSEVAGIAKAWGMRYTRYADDLALSTTSKQFTLNDAQRLVKQLHNVLQRHGLKPNYAKTRIAPPSGRQIVLGLSVSEGSPHLSRSFKDQMRLHVHFLTHPTIGPARHANHLGFDSVLGLQHHVLGLLAFARGVEPKWAGKIATQLAAVPWPTSSALPFLKL